MNKKGQFYLFTMVILLSATFFSLTNNSKVERIDKGYDDVYKNYLREANYVINSARYDGENATARMIEYTDSFISMAHAKSIVFSVFFLIVEEDQMYLVNYLKEPVTITDISLELQPGDTYGGPVLDEFEVDHDGEPFYFNISELPVQFSALINIDEI